MIVSLNRFLVVSAVVPLLPQTKTKSYYTNFKITTHKHQFAPEQIMIFFFFFHLQPGTHILIRHDMFYMGKKGEFSHLLLAF